MVRGVLRDTPLTLLSFVSLDLETTGTAPAYDDIIEVGCARFEVSREGVVRPGPVYERLVRPTRAIPPTTSALTGIDAQTVARAEDLGTVWPELLAFLRDDGEGGARTVLLAHRAESDLGFLVAAAERLGEPWQGPPFVCTLALSREVFPDAPRHTLGALARWLGAPEGAVFHRALPDALHARNLFARAVARRQAPSLRRLGVRQFEPIPRPGDLAVEVPARLRLAEQALHDGATVLIRYRGGSQGDAPRPVTPLGFYQHNGRVWMRAICGIEHVAKSFRCDRVRDVQPLAAHDPGTR